MLDEQIRVCTWIAARDFNGTAGLGIKLLGTHPADNGVSVAELTQGFERFQEQPLTHAETAGFLANPGGSEKPTQGGVMACEADDLSIPRGDEAGHGLATHGHFRLAGPLIAEMLAHEGFDPVFFEGPRQPQDDAFRGDVCVNSRGIWQIIEAHQHVSHESSQSFFCPLGKDGVGNSGASFVIPPI